jgi:hypothetical protein
MKKELYGKYSIKDLYNRKICKKCIGCQRKSKYNGNKISPDVNMINWHSNVDWSIEKEWCPVFIQKGN